MTEKGSNKEISPKKNKTRPAENTRTIEMGIDVDEVDTSSIKSVKMELNENETANVEIVINENFNNTEENIANTSAEEIPPVIIENEYEMADNGIKPINSAASEVKNEEIKIERKSITTQTDERESPNGGRINKEPIACTSSSEKDER